MLRKIGRVSLALFVFVMLAFVLMPVQTIRAAQNVGEQALLKMRFVVDGPQAQGSGILQTGEDSNLSAAQASATLTQLVAAPASNAIYIRGVFVEKSTGAAGTYTLQYGTGTNCGTGTTVLMGPVTNPLIGYAPVGTTLPAGVALCAQTDAATTSIRVLTTG